MGGGIDCVIGTPGETIHTPSVYNELESPLIKMARGLGAGIVLNALSVQRASISELSHTAADGKINTGPVSQYQRSGAFLYLVLGSAFRR